MMNYHAHIYFTLEKLKEAQNLLALAKGSSHFSFAGLVQRPVGPHPLPMIELHFHDQDYPLTLTWLNDKRGDFSVLIHQDTGDDILDHTEKIVWLGESLKLHFTFFELIKNRPEFKIH